MMFEKQKLKQLYKQIGSISQDHENDKLGKGTTILIKIVNKRKGMITTVGDKFRDKNKAIEFINSNFPNQKK